MAIKHLLLAAALFLSVTQTQAQLVVSPELSAPHTPIFVALAAPVEPNTTVKTIWTSDLPQSSYVDLGDNRLAVWAPPGEHFFEVLVVAQSFEEIDVFKPNPDDPKNLDKGTWEKRRVSKDFSINKYREKFTVTGVVPNPTPGPDPTPGPGPTPTPGPTPGGLAGEVQAVLKSMPTGVYDKAKALDIADNYITVGSQGSDPARSGGWTLATFGSETKRLNADTLGSEGVAAWGTPFFLPAAKMIAKLSTDRGIGDRDIQKMAALWTEFGEALKAAAY